MDKDEKLRGLISTLCVIAICAVVAIACIPETITPSNNSGSHTEDTTSNPVAGSYAEWVEQRKKNEAINQKVEAINQKVKDKRKEQENLSPKKEIEPINTDALLTPVSFYNGQIINHPSDEGLCPLEIKVLGSDSYYVVLDSMSSSLNDMAFMVASGSSTEVLVPLGTYEIYYASGETWYGTTHHFGSNTSYSKCEGTFRFYDDGQYYQGWTLELYKQSDGNMDTETISESEFPG